MAELEQVSIARPIDEEKSEKVSLDAEQRFRLTLRPTLYVRPNERVTISVLPYFKLPLGFPWSASRDGGPFDNRSDIFTQLEVKLGPSQTALENVALVLEYDHYFDNAPALSLWTARR